jgi:hypothetical protein
MLPILGLCTGFVTRGIVLYPPFVLPPVPGLTLPAPEFLTLGIGFRGQAFPAFSSVFSLSVSGAGEGMIGEGDLICPLPVCMASGEKFRSYVLGTAP